ncbi:leucyl aminopeptidase family protein [Lichenicoccus roseus]|uniref:Leucyl aminopeptidase family protein n=2 Tax=Lichenicoccus roseus TaxID=2683649 RepID=A0A5R9J780_9PROT|nr:leucyl aminopeptidase family protein [Lichenicoccus roseus]
MTFMFDRPLDCLVAADRATGVRPVHVVRPESLDDALGRLGGAGKLGGWLRDIGFTAKAGELALLPGEAGVSAALLGIGSGGEPPGPYAYAGLPRGLPPGDWQLEGPELPDADRAVLGFCLGAYGFRPYRDAEPRQPARLVTRSVDPSGDGASGAAQARAIWLARDLINMPANALGPAELADAAREVAAGFGADVSILQGEAIERGYPAIHAVGRGSPRTPRVVRAEWRGSAATGEAPLVSLVGKGVCFDTGGLDLKPSAAMLRMKKDMGGAAIMLGLARLIMERDLPVRLQLRLGCVENSVSGEAMRPSDVIATRAGLHIEIGNTDAEGRLVLCDLLDEACEDRPDVLIDAATLTGAARVALGPDLPALFCNDDALAGALLRGGVEAHDPVWRLPLHAAYDDWLSSSVGHLNNVSSKPMAGAVTAALFLQRFVKKSVPWAHLDTYAWRDSASPGRPEGGDAQGLGACYRGLLQTLNLQG